MFWSSFVEQVFCCFLVSLFSRIYIKSGLLVICHSPISRILSQEKLTTYFRLINRSTSEVTIETFKVDLISFEDVKCLKCYSSMKLLVSSYFAFQMLQLNHNKFTFFSKRITKASSSPMTVSIGVSLSKFIKNYLNNYKMNFH